MTMQEHGRVRSSRSRSFSRSRSRSRHRGDRDRGERERRRRHPWSRSRSRSRSRSHSRSRSRSPIRRSRLNDRRYDGYDDHGARGDRDRDRDSRDRDRDRDRGRSDRGRRRRPADRIVVRGLPHDVDEDTVRYTFAPYAGVDFVDLVPDSSLPGLQFAFVRFSSHRGASTALETVQNMDPPLQIGAKAVTVEWADDDEHRRFVGVLGHSRRSEVQEQLDWVTANSRPQQQRPYTQHQQQQQQSNAMGGFVWDAKSGYFFSAERRMYYEPNSKMYYSMDNGCYFRYDAATNSFSKVEVPPQQVAVPTDGDTTDAVSEAASANLLQQQQQQQQQQHQKEEEALKEARKVQKQAEAAVEQALAETPVLNPVVKERTPLLNDGSVKFSLAASGKRVNKDMQRWKQKHEQLEVEAEAARAKGKAMKEGRPKFLSGANAMAIQMAPAVDAETTAPAPSPAPVSTKVAVADASGGSKHGIRPRVYVSVENKVCLLCQRQFKDEVKLDKHELHSDLHKKNLQLDEYEKVKRVEASAKALGIELAPKTKPKKHRKPKKRPFVSLHTESRASSSAKPEEPLGESNVGNKLLQAMGWKQGQGLGKHGTGITAPVTAQMHSERAGLGSQPSGVNTIEAGDDRKTVALKMARSRYEHARVVPDPVDASVDVEANTASTTRYSEDPAQRFVAQTCEGTDAAAARPLLE